MLGIVSNLFNASCAKYITWRQDNKAVFIFLFEIFTKYQLFITVILKNYTSSIFTMKTKYMYERNIERHGLLFL